MGETVPYYRRHLPHYQPVDGIFFITFRLAGSLPAEVVDKLRIEKMQLEESAKSRLIEHEEKKLPYRLNRRYFQKFEALLDGWDIARFQQLSKKHCIGMMGSIIICGDIVLCQIMCILLVNLSRVYQKIIGHIL